jgi:hypothetical protein
VDPSIHRGNCPAAKEFMMRGTILLLVLLVPMRGIAQTTHDHHQDGGLRASVSRADGQKPSQPGQAAFAAIQEIVEILEADPRTDWSKVNIEALRRHLIDMDNVTLHADVKSEPIDGGIRFTVSGTGPVRDSIQRMVVAHAMTMDRVGGWTFLATKTDDGAILDVTTPVNAARMLHGLGFIGVLTRGMHHQAHHLMLARGEDPHP